MLPTTSRPVLAISFSLLIVLVALAPFAMLRRTSAASTPAPGSSAAPVTVVSAASYGSTLAPDSVAAAFGDKLATQTAIASGDADPTTPGIQLPTQLGGTTVEINGVRAGLFFVSPNQINFVIPATTTPGTAIVSVRAGDGVLSMGEVQVSAVAPVIFTANASGSGLPAAVLLRIDSNGVPNYESLAPITWKTATDHVFLLLYLSGTRGAVDTNNDNNLNDSVRVSLGGQEVVPAFIGKSDFAGVEQLNVEIPRNLGGRGTIPLAVSYATQAVSNVVNIEIAGTPQTQVTVSGFSPTTAYVGDEITINGGGFALNADGNQVFMVEATQQRPIQATKLTVVNANQLKAIVPFGAGSGVIRVGDAVGSTKLTLHTSVSGFVETTQAQPLPGVTVRMRGTNISTVTDAEGKFILRDAPPGSQTVEIDPTGLPLPFPSVTTKVQVFANRDTHMDRRPLQQVTGPNLTFNAPAGFAPDFGASLSAAPAARAIQTGGATFEVDDATTAIFPNGSSTGAVFLDIVEKSRTPVKLPPGIFSSTIVQLTPFGVKLTPGGRLTFPNSDNLPANQPAKLYKLDQTAGSATLGQFIEAGTAQVSADGKTVATAPNAITETSYYFVAIPRPVTTLVGRVVDSDGTTPVGEALVRARNQSAFTNSLGEFLLPDIAVSGANDQLTVEASYQRPGGRVDRAQPRTVAPVLNNVTRVVPDIVLPSPATTPNRPPTIIAPSSLSVTEGVTLDTDFVVSDPDAGQTVQVTVSGVSFASVSLKSGNVYTLRLTPGAGTAGSLTLAVKATDNQNASTTQNIALTVFPNRPPALTVPGPQIAQVGQNISFKVSAIDPDVGQMLMFSAPGLPTGATLIQTSATSAQFNWTPSASQVGGSTVSVTVSDNGLQVLSNTKTVTVNVATPWTQTAGPYGGDVRSLLVSGGSVFAGTFRGGVFRSTDSGANWTAVNSGLRDRHVFALALNGTILFAGTGGGVYRTMDNGANWTAANNGLGTAIVQALAVSGTTLFAGTYSGVYCTSDNGANWMAINDGLPNQIINALAVNSTALFAGTYDKGVFRSTDNGANWTAVNTGLGNPEIRSLVVSGMNLFVGTNNGVFRTSDNGANWTAINNNLGDRIVYSLCVSGSILFAGTRTGIYRTTDNGANWMMASNGIADQYILALVVSGTTLFAGTDTGGVFRTTDNGANWMAVNNGFSSQGVLSLALSGTTLFAGTDTGGVFRTTNNGANWVLVNNGLSKWSINAMVVSGTTLFAGTYGGGVYRTTDNGANWIIVNNGLADQFVNALALNGTTLFAGTRSGIYRTTDNGTNWAVVNNGLSNRYVNTLAVSGMTLLAGTYGGGVYRTTDNGANWTVILGNQSVFALAISDIALFAATLDSGVYRTVDNGQNWISVNSGLGNQIIFTLAASGTTLFAGTADTGVFCTNDNGENWISFNEGLTNLSVNSFAVSGTNLFIGTNGSSVYVRRLQ